ncbi:MAG: type IX secretion system outer membrane channel protein PorV [Sphingobacteriales bacterium]
MTFFSGKTIIFFISIFLPSLAIAQTSGVNTNGTNSTAIPTAVPFLNITPDSRSGALGEAGVAISPDVNANYWNPAKLAFLESDDAVSLSYTPWLRQLVPDINLAYLSYAHKLDDRNTVGASLKYFNYGTIQITDNQGTNQTTFNPNEFSLNASFARKFGDELSLGLTAGYIHSNLSNQSFASGTSVQANAGNAIAAGVSLFYTKKLQEFGTDGIFSFGTNISNIGSKISYSAQGPKYFLPANLKIGAADMVNLDDYNQLTFTLDFNKLLVPTPPITDSNGNIIKGQSDNISVPAGIFSSFTDAPGGFHEELQEITISPGIEYWYNQLFSLRAGYYYQNPNKGNEQYLTMGVGFKYEGFQFDFSYIAASQQSSPIANTIRFTLTANFGGEKNAAKKQ